MKLLTPEEIISTLQKRLGKSMLDSRVQIRTEGVKKRENSGYYTVCNNRWNNGLCPKQNGKKAKCAECPN